MNVRKFTNEEMRYLLALEAVREVTPTRITYTDEFKRECLRRYLTGASPVTMFREVGLTPEIVGRKRIERCMARWRDKAEDILGEEWKTASTGVQAVSAAASVSSAGVPVRTVRWPWPFRFAAADSRDSLIALQAQHIAALEQQIETLRRMVEARDGSAVSSAAYPVHP